MRKLFLATFYFVLDNYQRYRYRGIKLGRSFEQLARVPIAAVGTLSLMFSFICSCAGTIHSIAPLPSGMRGTMGATSGAWTDAQCQTLHNEEIAITTVTAVVAALSGSTGISAAFVNDPHGQQIALGVTSIVSAAVSAGGGIWLHFIQDDFSEHCMVNQPVTPPIASMPAFVNPAATAPAPLPQPVITPAPRPISAPPPPVVNKPPLLRPEMTCVGADCQWYKTNNPVPIPTPVQQGQ